MDKKLSPLSSGDEQPPTKSVTPKQYENLPVSILPHAKGFQNGFLGEMDDAAKAGIIYTMVDLFVPLSLTDNKIGLPDFSALFRGSHESVVVVSTIRGLYVTTAILITLAALSVAGKDYRKIVDFRGERKQEQRDVDDRDEENVEGLSAIGAAGGLGLGLLLLRSPLFRPPLNAALPSQFQIFRLPLLLGFTCAGVQLANGLSYNCRKFRKWSGQ